MKYWINLYTSRFRPRHLVLERRALVVCVALSALMVVFSGVWLGRVNLTLADEHQSLTSGQAELEARMLGLSSSLEKRKENGDLLLSVAQEMRVVTGKRQLIKQLAGRLLLDVGFSHYMRGLSQSHVDGLWLTRVRADGSNLILDGSSLSEDLLPQWIQQLSTQADFQGKNFGLLELSRQKDAATPQLDFHLSTQLKREEKGNG